MCGIVGWVDFRRELAGERPTVQAMTDAIASRGIDDHGLWMEPHACLGHTRTAVIDPAGGIQPMVAEEDGRPIAVLVYSGEIYNFRQLRSELIGRGHHFRTRSDTEVVLRSYLEWGADCGKRLEGMFAFGVWDIRTEELLLVRDRIGIKPLFYKELDGGILFGSEPKALLTHPLVRPLVTLDGLREVFTTARTPGASVFRELAELRPGHTLTVGRNGIVDRTYWQLEARPHTEDLEQTIGTIRSMLEDIVLRELVADVPICTGLSGGIDSSVITALAGRWMWKLEGERVRTVTTTFEGHSENFRPDDTRDTPDAPYAAELVRQLDSDHTDLVLRTADLMDPEVRMTVLRAQDKPSVVGDMEISHYLMLRAIRGHSSVVLTGEVSDEIFCGFRWMHEPEYANAHAYPWVAREQLHEGSKDVGLGRGLFDRDFLKKLDMAGYYADSYSDALAEAPHQEGESEQEHRMRAICYTHLARWMPVLLERGDRLAMAHGLETRVPYCDHRLVEYLYNVPWEYKAFDGRDKSLLRAAAKDLLPQSIVDRPKSPWPVIQDPAYTEALHQELAAVLADRNSPVLPLLDVEAAKRAAGDSTEAAQEWQTRVNIETALQFNSWLTHYDLELAI